jgi:hypothetical protein
MNPDKYRDEAMVLTWSTVACTKDTPDLVKNVNGITSGYGVIPFDFRSC